MGLNHRECEKTVLRISLRLRLRISICKPRCCQHNLGTENSYGLTPLEVVGLETSMASSRTHAGLESTMRFVQLIRTRPVFQLHKVPSRPITIITGLKSFFSFPSYRTRVRAHVIVSALAFNVSCVRYIYSTAVKCNPR